MEAGSIRSASVISSSLMGFVVYIQEVEFKVHTMMKPSEERGQFTNPKVIFLYLACTSGSPGELLKLHMPELYPIAITAESQGLESRLYYNFRLPLGPLYSKAENGWFEERCLPKYLWLV